MLGCKSGRGSGHLRCLPGASSMAGPLGRNQPHRGVLGPRDKHKPRQTPKTHEESDSNFMDAQPNHGARRRRRRKKPNSPKAAPVEPVFIVARRPDSPRLEKPTRRMKAASARPRGLGAAVAPKPAPGEVLAKPEVKVEEEAALRKERRQARIVVRATGAPDEAEKNRLRLLSRLMAAEGRAAISRAIDAYLAEGFELPREQDVQLKLLEHFDETKAASAIALLTEIIATEGPRQLPVLRQRLRRLEDHADEESIRSSAALLRRQLPA